ncbi:MAG TPA: ATP-binding protein [Burkholderiaceae bacterium]
MTTSSTQIPPSDAAPRLCIVDDEAELTLALCSTLRAEGYETIGFTSAQAALAALPEAHCDLLLVDLNMPQMLGPDLLRAAQHIDPAIVGIIMTGEGSIAAAVEAMKAGALDFILKPFNISAIVPVLARALQVRQLRLENARLEQRVREHAAELEAANRELAAFNHSVSHDLRAPLRAVDGLSELLMNSYASCLPAEAQRFLATMNLSVKRMKQLVDDLLRFSSLGHQALRPRPVDMATIVHSVLNDLRVEQSSREVEVHIGELPQAVGDPALLLQVLANLLSNAYKFTRRQEHAVIEIGSQMEPDGTQAYFVRDNGAGFDMAYAKRLFGVFQRLHGAGEFEGTGVGLSIVQRIVERHHGRVWAEAAVGRGATFYFTLGAAKDA